MTRYSLFVALCAIFLSSCSLPGDAAPVVKIGLIAPFEGLGRPLGYAVLPAVKTAIAEANAGGPSLSGGGELGRYRVALVALNDDLDPRAAAAQARALAQDRDVLAVLGPWSEATASAAAPLLSQAGIPALLAAPVKDPPDGVRSLCPSPAEIAAGNHKGLPLLASQPTLIYLGDAAAAAEDLLRWQTEGWQGTLLGGPDLARPWFIGRAGAAAEGTQAVVCDAGTWGRGDVKAWGEGDAATAHAADLAYAGTRILLRALAQDIAAHGRPTRAGVTAALAGQTITPRLVWLQVKGGQWADRARVQHEPNHPRRTDGTIPPDRAGSPGGAATGSTTAPSGSLGSSPPGSAPAQRELRSDASDCFRLTGARCLVRPTL